MGSDVEVALIVERHWEGILGHCTKVREMLIGIGDGEASQNMIAYDIQTPRFAL